MKVLFALAALAAIAIAAPRFANAAAPGACSLNARGHCEDSSKVASAPRVKAAGVNKPVALHGVPSWGCRDGFFQQGARLCMTGYRGSESYANAELDCMDLGARVADYHDWRYRILRGDGILAPVGWWLGGITADNTALYANLPNVGDFDGETSRFDIRGYACAHDLF